MGEQVLHKCDFIEITTDGKDFYIESFRKGFSIDQFNKIMNSHPQIRITSLATIKSAIVFAPRPKEKFGELKQRVAVEISPDGFKAFVTLAVTPEELAYENRRKLKDEIVAKLAMEGVLFGIKEDVLLGSLENGQKTPVAEGRLPQNGKDCEIRMYEVKEPKPLVHADGSVDHYELNLINHVTKDEWLGERIEATPGEPGRNVKGVEVPPVPGKTIQLQYDKTTVYEVTQGNKTILYSLIGGAVNHKDGKISVSNHLEINGNVDFSTGNIEFDGCVTIKGTIDDNFIVVADGDIEVLDEYGIGSVRSLESRKGSIYIKGGISSRNKIKVRAARNVFVKYAANAEIEAGELVHIGYYCINSDITAKEVLVDSSKGQIIGGVITAEARVVANTIGTPSEKRTHIIVRGINKEKIRIRLEDITADLQLKRERLIQLKNDIASASNNKAGPREIENLKEELADINRKIKMQEEEKKALGVYLRIHGDGEVVVQRKIYPNCMIEIKGSCKEISQACNAMVFYASDGELKEKV